MPDERAWVLTLSDLAALIAKPARRPKEDCALLAARNWAMRGSRRCLTCGRSCGPRPSAFVLVYAADDLRPAETQPLCPLCADTTDAKTLRIRAVDALVRSRKSSNAHAVASAIHRSAAS